MRGRKIISIPIRIIIIAIILAAALCVRLTVSLTDDSTGEYLPVFSDVSEELKPYVELVYKEGIVGSGGGGKFGINDKVTINETAYITVALCERVKGLERTFTWYSPDNDEYIGKAEEYGIWPEFDRDRTEYVTLDDIGAVLGYYVDDTYPIYGDAVSFKNMSTSLNSDHVLKLYNCGVTLDSSISRAYTAEEHATREDITRLVCMIINPANRLTELKKDYTELERQLTEQMSGYAGDWSLYFKDVDNDDTISINSHQVYSASLIKLYVIQAVYSKMCDGSLSDTSSTEELLRRMITWSDNEAWQSLARLLGGGSYSVGMSYVTSVAQNTGFADTGTFYRGSKKNFNFTSVNDCGNYLDMLLKGQIVNEDYSSRILELMKQQQVRHKIPAGVPEGVVTANKTGELEYVQGDAAVIYSPECTYILVIIADDLINTSEACNGITELSRMIYGYINE